MTSLALSTFSEYIFSVLIKRESQILLWIHKQILRQSSSYVQVFIQLLALLFIWIFNSQASGFSCIRSAQKLEEIEFNSHECPDACLRILANNKKQKLTSPRITQSKRCQFSDFLACIFCPKLIQFRNRVKGSKTQGCDSSVKMQNPMVLAVILGFFKEGSLTYVNSRWMGFWTIRACFRIE